MMDKLKQTLAAAKHHSRHIGHARLGRLLLAGVIIWSIVLPVFGMIRDIRSYQLSADTLGIIGQANANLSAKFSYDATNDQWQFNKDGTAVQAQQIAQQQGTSTSGVASALAQLKAQQVGGGGKGDNSLYSANLPVKADKGITYYDNDTQLSFSMVPEFKMADGKLWQGRIVYPMADGIQLVYTAKANGLKEDIVLSHNIGDSLSYSYKLNLPDTLVARQQDDGSIGIFSADPSLFGNISFGSNEDEAKVMDARKNAPKNHLVFDIPAPVLKGKDGQVGKAFYGLDANNNLTVSTSGLDQLSYPLSVDPSVVVTSSSDFSLGNDEDNMIDYSTADQIGRAEPSGGSVSTWTTSGTTLPSNDFGFQSFTYDGYIYLLGGCASGNPVSCSSYVTNNVEYATISGATIGSWTVASNQFSTGRMGFGAIEYAGFLYIIGGLGHSGNLNDVQYAKIDPSTGDLGTWQTGPNFVSARANLSVAAYDGYIYVGGGFTGSGGTYYNDVQYAPINADGSIAGWNPTSSTATSAYGKYFGAAGGYFYSMGGCTTGGCSGFTNAAEYAPIHSDGTLGSFNPINNLPQSMEVFDTEINDGYIYVMAGYKSGNVLATVYFAQLNANGTIGAWQTTNSLSTARKEPGSVLSNGYLLVMGGESNSNVSNNSIEYAQISPSGTAGPYATSGNTFTTTRRGGQTVAYGGYLYELGGDNGSTPVNTVYKAAIASDGTIGTFAATTAFSTANGGPNALTYFSAVAYNGYMYLVGGCTSAYASCTTAANDTANVYMDTINSDGTLGASWTAQTAFTTGRYGLSAVAYNGYIYVMGGLNASTFKNDIQYHAIGTSGAISGAWTTSAKTLPANEAYQQAVVYGGVLYVAGGCTAGALTCSTTVSTVNYAPLASSGDLNSTLGPTNGFTTGRGMFGLAAVNGYLYITGGQTNGTYYSDTQFAPIKSDGSVDTWATSSASVLATTRYGIGMAAAQGYLYVGGGYNGTTYYNNIQIAPVYNGGGGAADSWDTATNLYTGVKDGHASVVYNGYLYVVGGYGVSNTYENDIQYAPLNGDGTVGTWNSTTNLGAATTGLGAVAYNGYLYVLGGEVSGGSQNNTVQYASINSNGTLAGSWNSAAPFTTGREEFGVDVYNGYMYILGGKSSSGYLNDVQYAPIGSNGNISSWTPTISFTTARGELASVAYDGYLYVMGGDSSGGYLNDVQYAPINSNGTIGSWATTTSFNLPRDYIAATTYNGFLYILGGSVGGSLAGINDVQVANINGNGTVGPWGYTSSFSTNRLDFRAVVYNGYMYITGGYNNVSGYLTDVQYGQLDTINRVAHYSTMVTLPTVSNVTGVYFNGTVSPNSYVQYATAAGTDKIFSSLSDYAKQGSGSDPGLVCAASGTGYVWILVTLDDSQTATFAGDNPSKVTDLTIYYDPSSRPPPDQRLRGGQWFYSETLQPLDTCGP